MPPIVCYGEKAELRMRNTKSIPGGWEQIVHDLCGPKMQVVRISSTQWAYNAAMARPGESPQILETVALPKPELTQEQIGAYNQQIRDSA
jgi:hypothetical protein